MTYIGKRYKNIYPKYMFDFRLYLIDDLIVLLMSSSYYKGFISLHLWSLFDLHLPQRRDHGVSYN